MNSMSIKQDGFPLKEKTNFREKAKPQESRIEEKKTPRMKPLEFEDETKKTYGI